MKCNSLQPAAERVDFRKVMGQVNVDQRWYTYISFFLIFPIPSLFLIYFFRSLPQKGRGKARSLGDELLGAGGA